jgi:hypothetical protein
MPVAGGRSFINGSVGNVGSLGIYWSSTVSGIFASFLEFTSSTSFMTSQNRANGMSVRCLKD